LAEFFQLKAQALVSGLMEVALLLNAYRVKQLTD
jgi:hypothetical protein